MVSVTEQYEAYPYPERDPADEAKRLIQGSPSHPIEIDHWLFGGSRDWSTPFRVLVAGGGTGDGLIQLAQVLTSAGVPHEIIYVDLSVASRRIAEARAEARGLSGITFVTGSLLDAPSLGRFDYIDCCGVLHHLPDPVAGFSALRAALAPGGGLGFMVYAPYGRSGVYPLQAAFGALFDGLPPEARLKKAKALLERLPEGHPFKVNPVLSDHRASDAGFYDLLLHGQDVAFSVPDLLVALKASDWRLMGFTVPALYDPARYGATSTLAPEQAMAVAEQLCGTIRVHVGYAVPADDGRAPPSGRKPGLVPHLKGAQPQQLAKSVAAGKPVPLTLKERSAKIALPPEAAPVLAAIDGRQNLGQIAAAVQMDPLAFNALWGRISAELTAWGLLLYSGLGR
jgi:SAM-dependent methyltransferase